jgi:hypothetical protein
MKKPLLKWLCFVFCILIGVFVFVNSEKVTANALDNDNIKTPVAATPVIYGRVQLDNFFCQKTDSTTTRILLYGIFINTSAAVIKHATITVEFIDLENYSLGSSEYTPVASFTVVVRGVDINNEKSFREITDVTVDDPQDNIYDMWMAPGYKLGVFYYKIDCELDNIDNIII